VRFALPFEVEKESFNRDTGEFRVDLCLEEVQTRAELITGVETRS
jgi:hypothetical protein